MCHSHKDLSHKIQLTRRIENSMYHPRKGLPHGTIKLIYLLLYLFRVNNVK